MLQYILNDNFLTAAPNDFWAQPVNVRSYTQPEVIRRILARNPGLSEAQLTSAINEYTEEAGIITEEGGAINTPLVNTNLSISGVFEGAADTFDSKRHRTKVNANPGLRLTQAASKIKPRKTTVADPVPQILEVKDIVSGSVNDVLTLGGVIRITGSRLKFLPEEPDNGIFLINEQGEETKLTVIAENKPARLMAMLPPNQAQGIYWVEVRTTFSTVGKPGKTLKAGRFGKELTL